MPDLRSTFNRLSEEVEPTVHRRSENAAPLIRKRCTVSKGTVHRGSKIKTVFSHH
ncbi:hypothetical protein FSA03_07055 [Bacteroides fragilis]|uniref:Uncharacterized protein n=1 Tax=Bacteroides fragilis TaxID=817 RepID=A0AB38PQU4_BACFG|nr:hypothetical protein F9Z90_03785 [Bacteroides fragilis]TWV41742.1 hypothetical protein FSA06_11995 [Bacteroides fragilis]TWV51361.1 hypothetical protein FSA03_07055 [Bacteroides fragilis]